MQAEDVINLYKLLQENEIGVWIDGGWGIDALFGEQTRPHDDLDIAIERKNVENLRRLLNEQGYKEKKRNSDWNFVLVNGSKEIDVHVFEFDDKGNNIYGIAYSKESLAGTGTIDGNNVKCISPEWVIKFHANYEPKDKDFKDIQALCEKFDLEQPKNYKKL